MRVFGSKGQEVETLNAPKTMNRIATFAATTSILALLLVAIPGCTDSPASGDSAAQPAGQPANAANTTNATPPVRQPIANPPSRRAGMPPVRFDPPSMQFGLLAPGAVAQGTTRIYNDGPEPVRIARSITSCGCTSAERLDGRVIQPGAFTEFGTSMEMKPGLGFKKEKVTITFDGFHQPYIYFYEAEVALAVRVSPPFIAASVRQPNGSFVQAPQGRLKVASQDGLPFSILASHGRAPSYIGFDPAVDAPRSEYSLVWNMARFAGGDIPWFWVLETDHPDAPVVDIRLRHSSTLPQNVAGRPWQPKGQRVLLGEIVNSQPVQVTVKHEFNAGRTPVPATARVRGNSSVLDVRLLGAERDGQFLKLHLELTPINAAPGLFYETIEVGSAGFLTDLRVIGRVVG